MRGHVLKRGGTWGFVHDVEPSSSGRRRQSWKGGFTTKREAQTALTESLARHAKGGRTGNGTVTLMAVPGLLRDLAAEVGDLGQRPGRDWAGRLC